MRLEHPRIAPVLDEELTKAQHEILEPHRQHDLDHHNVVRTLLHHPIASSALSSWSSYIMRDSTINPRDRELLILRTGWLCQAEYEWSRHKIHGANAGLSDSEIEAVKTGASHAKWSEKDKLLLNVCDDLISDHFISDDSWQSLSRLFDERQMMDIVFTVGQYVMVSMALNSFGVQLDEGVSGF